MGYYTRYRLSVLPFKSEEESEQIHNFYDDVESNRIYNFDSMILQDVLDSSDTLKWYDHDEDMLKLSKLYPLITFLLQGEGREDQVDVWRCYYKNGKSVHQDAELRFDDPDLSVLD